MITIICQLEYCSTTVFYRYRIYWLHVSYLKQILVVKLIFRSEHTFSCFNVSCHLRPSHRAQSTRPTFMTQTQFNRILLQARISSVCMTRSTSSCPFKLVSSCLIQWTKNPVTLVSLRFNFGWRLRNQSWPAVTHSDC